MSILTFETKLFSALLITGIVSYGAAVSAMAAIDLTPATAAPLPGTIERDGGMIDRVEVRYRQKGRLLAIVPVRFDVKVVAHKDGKLDLAYPWYSVFTVDNDEEVRAELRVAVDNALRAMSVGSVRAEGERRGFSPEETAEVTRVIEKVLKARLAVD